MIDPRQAALVAPRFLDLLHSTEFTSRGIASVGRGKTGREVGFGGELEMEANFFSDTGFDFPSSEMKLKPEEKLTKPDHTN
jgi:hypothetical protein